MRGVSVSRSTAVVGLSFLLLVLVLAGNHLARTGTARPAEATTPLDPVGATAPGEPVGVAPSTSALVVHVVGAVRRPGLYRMGEGKRVADAIARAGGAAKRADLAALNIAAPLVDGTQVLVPARVNAACGNAPSRTTGGSEAAPGPATVGAGPKVSLSTATAEQLDALPGVGPATAQKILDYRAEYGPFGSVDDLDAVPGIGPTRIDELRDLVTP
jgi:competence protein ComEA